MKLTFNITTTSLQSNSTQLFICFSYQNITFVEYDSINNIFKSIFIYEIDNTIFLDETATSINNLLQTESFFQKEFTKVEIIWCNPESILVPKKYFDISSKNDMINLVFGDNENTSIKYDESIKNNIFNIYKIPNLFEKYFCDKFPLAQRRHQALPIINIEPNQNDFFYCNFNSSSFLVFLRKNKQLQIIQKFDFTTPTDVIYHLLQVCKIFGINASSTIINVNGMITESSILYNELYKYFSAIKLYGIKDIYNVSQEISNYPSHYFSHLFAIILCEL